jgi:hypothetical protein
VVQPHPAAMQHCLLKAVDVDPLHAPSWSSLALMYLQHGERCHYLLSAINIYYLVL